MYALKDLLEIDRQFQTAVNLRLDREDEKKLAAYLPTSSSVQVLSRYLRSILDKKGGNASLLIGPYGKGKSHLLLVLLAALEQRFPDAIARTAQRVEEVDPECGALLRRAASGKPYLSVLLTDTGENLNAAFLIALQEALERSGFKELAPDSYYTEALRTLKRWKTEFPDTYERFSVLISREGWSGQELEERLRGHKRDAMELFKRLYPSLTAGCTFQPLLQTEAVRVYQEVLRQLCGKHGYGGIYIVFDEFGKYIEGHNPPGFSLDMKVLQDMCELANTAEGEELYITFVAHKSLKEYGGRLPEEVRNAFRGVEGRLREYLFVVSVRNSFDLIRSVLRKKPAFERAYREGMLSKYAGELTEKAFELAVFHTRFSREEYEETVASGCFPLTPVAAVLLLSLCEKIAQNERTVFTFLSNEEPGSVFSRVSEGGKSGELYLGADCIYDYFSPVLRQLMDMPEVHNEWLKAEYALRRIQGTETEETDARIVKSMAMLNIAGSREELPADCRCIGLAAGISGEECRRGMERLKERQLVLWRSKLGIFGFRNNVGIDLEEELARIIDKQPARLPLAELLEKHSELEYVLPKVYNQSFFMTRYFQYVYMEPKAFFHIGEPEYLFEESFADGKLIALIRTEPADSGEMLRETAEWKDERLAAVVPARPFGQLALLRRILAVKELLDSPEFLEDNKVLEQELCLYREDLLFELNAELEQDYLPQNGGCEVYWGGKRYTFSSERGFNSFLSGICGSYYNFSPKINHELLNIRNVAGQYLKARNRVVEQILSGGELRAYEKGTSPEALVYRTALLRTGVIANEKFTADPGSSRILEEIRCFMTAGASERRCFGGLYDRLQGKEYGVRKGVLPLFLALELMAVAGTPVLYLNTKEVPLNADILNNINERPGEYFLYLERDTLEKEAYLRKLESFLGTCHPVRGRRERFRVIAEAMQRRYRSLPKAVSNWKRFDREEWLPAPEPELMFEAAAGMKSALRRMELNPRELLLESIPGWLGRPADGGCGEQVCHIFRVWENKLTRLEGELAGKCLAVWGAEPDASLNGCLREWLRRNGGPAATAVLSAKGSLFFRYVESLQGYDNLQVLSGLAYALEGICVEDWTEETAERFLTDIVQIKQEIEGLRDGPERQGQKRILFTGVDGSLVERYYRAEESGIAEFLKNAVREALEEFGDSMEPGEKAAVLVETLEEVLK